MYDKGLIFMAIAVIDRRCVFLLFCAGAAHVMDLPRAALCSSSLFLSVKVDIVIRFWICELTCAGTSFTDMIAGAVIVGRICMFMSPIDIDLLCPCFMY